MHFGPTNSDFLRTPSRKGLLLRDGREEKGRKRNGGEWLPVVPQPLA